MSEVPTTELLTRLPPSPSSSVLSLDSHTEEVDEPSPKRLLGLRELRKFSREGKRSPEVIKKEIVVLGHPDVPASGSKNRSDVGNFAKEVTIKGWKVVGGKTWSDKAKVGAYVVYDIQIVLQSGGSIDILRRYTDFVNLRRDLKSAFPSSHANAKNLIQAIPPLPSKAHMSKFSPDFLEDRQSRLQRFLRTVLLHPQMGRGGEKSVIARWVMARDSS